MVIPIIIKKAKQQKRLRLENIKDKVSSARYVPNKSPWSLDDPLPCDFAFPCATQNEINGPMAKQLIEKSGCRGFFEGANLPITLDGQDTIRSFPDKVIYIPGKAANAGGVGVSGLEMAQNSQRLQWKRDDVDAKLQDMMNEIYTQMEQNQGDDGSLETGANRAGFIKVANAMRELGHIW